MKSIDTTQARQEFAETVNEVAYGRRRIVVSRRGRRVAAIVPVEDLDLIERCEQEEKARKRRPARPGARGRGKRSPS
jgi:prevent-host-death family protein